MKSPLSFTKFAIILKPFSTRWLKLIWTLLRKESMNFVNTRRLGIHKLVIAKECSKRKMVQMVKSYEWRWLCQCTMKQSVWKIKKQTISRSLLLRIHRNMKRPSLNRSWLITKLWKSPKLRQPFNKVSLMKSFCQLSSNQKLINQTLDLKLSLMNNGWIWDIWSLSCRFSRQIQCWWASYWP